MLTLLFQTTFQGAAEAVRRGLQLGFDVDFESPLWWKRQPKALEPDVAKAKLRKVAAVIVDTAQKQAAEPEAPPEQRKAEAKSAVSALLGEMPGFDWQAMYQAAYERAVANMIAERAKAQKQRAAEIARRRQQDEEEIMLLLALI